MGFCSFGTGVLADLRASTSSENVWLPAHCQECLKLRKPSKPPMISNDVDMVVRIC